MRTLSIIVVSLILSVFAKPSFSQQKPSVFYGTAKGILRDKADLHFLQAATATVYRTADSSLVNYRLSNNIGEFMFDKLPIATDLELVVTYLGYKSYRHRFIIPKESKNIELKYMDIEPAVNELDEIKITGYRAPVRMNGDTLEFNAEAFRLDPNAVVEDLMRRLPGVTVWGDGTITVNGKTVQQVLVDGKRFFGGDARVATQNLPKEAVDKIQVYSANQHQKTADSLYSVNIKLKPEWKSGIFGKLTGGYGTSRRYNSDGIINFFSPLTQLSIGGALNNTNIIAADMNVLMRNSSFKGMAATVEYQPDFNLEGAHRPRSAGIFVQHDLKAGLPKEAINRLETSYFLRDNLSQTAGNTVTVSSIVDEANIVQNAVSSAQTALRNQIFKTDYRIKNNKTIFYLSPLINDMSVHSLTGSGITSQKEGSMEMQSSSTSLNEKDERNTSINLRTGILSERKGLQIDYAFLHVEKELDASNSTNFISPLSPALNKKFNRTYDNRSSQMVHDVVFRYNNLLKLLFKSQDPEKFSAVLFNSFRTSTSNSDNHISDLDTASTKYRPNSYLTNVGSYGTLELRPGVRLERSWSKSLSRRYDKTLTINAEVVGQYYRQKNISQKAFQNIGRRYQDLLPAAGLSYSRGNGINVRNTYKLNFATSVIYPEIDQLAPLIDSTVIYYRKAGNTLLTRAYRSDLLFSLQHLSVLSDNNNVQYQLTVLAGESAGAISDSTVYDQLGRTVSYPVNVHGNRFLDVRAKYDRVFKVKNHQVQLNVNGNFNTAIIPVYINTESVRSHIETFAADLSLLYTFKDGLSLKIDGGISDFKTWQGSENHSFNNIVHKLGLAGTVRCFGQVVLNSNISLNSSASSQAPRQNFAIWNADVVYRFMKGKQCEIKFSALDLLKQNTGLINYGTSNSITTGNMNVLRHYFMVGLAYFPRKFGFKQN